MPAGLIKQQYGMSARRDVFGDFGEMQLHRKGVALGHNEGCALAFLGRYRAENIGRDGPLIMRCAGPRSAFGPSAGNFVLLANTGFVSEPNFYFVGGDALFARDLFQAGWQAFLKSSIAPSAWA
jgi:hypothetical protein